MDPMGKDAADFLALSKGVLSTKKKQLSMMAVAHENHQNNNIMWRVYIGGIPHPLTVK